MKTRRKKIVVQGIFLVCVIVYLCWIFKPAGRERGPFKSSGANFGDSGGDQGKSSERESGSKEGVFSSPEEMQKFLRQVEADRLARLKGEGSAEETGPLVRGFYLGMTEEEAKDLLKNYLGDDCDFSQRESTRRENVKIINFVSPSLCAKSKTKNERYEKENNYVDVDTATGRVIGFGFCGATCDAIFDSTNIEYSDFVRRFLTRYNIPVAEVDTSKRGITFHRYETSEYKITFGKNLSFNDYFKLIMIDRIPRGKF